MKSRAIPLLAAMVLTGAAFPARAGDNAFRNVLENSIYGGLAGTVVGAAVMALTEKPGEHWDYVRYGAAGGVLVGATYGILKTSNALAEVDRGRVKFALPALEPMPLRPGDGSVKAPPVILTAQVVRVRF